jgi:hypothetical protein
MDTDTRRDPADERVSFGPPDRALSALIRLGWDAAAAKSSGVATYSRTTELDQRIIREALLAPDEARALLDLLSTFDLVDVTDLAAAAKLRRIAGDS